MKYPKKIMSRPDLIKMGFSETYLRRAFATPGQTFAWQDTLLHVMYALWPMMAHGGRGYDG